MIAIGGKNNLLYPGFPWPVPMGRQDVLVIKETSTIINLMENNSLAR